MIGIERQFGEDVTLEIQFEYVVNRVDRAEIPDPAPSATPKDGLARFESSDLAITFEVPARLAGPVLIFSNGEQALLKSRSVFPSNFNFWIMDLPAVPESVDGLWTSFVEAIGTVPLEPPKTPELEQPSAYARATYQDSEIWVATVLLEGKLVAVMATASAINEAEFVSFLASFERPPA